MSTERERLAVLERFLQASDLNSLNFDSRVYGAYGLDATSTCAEAESLEGLADKLLELECSVSFARWETWPEQGPVGEAASDYQARHSEIVAEG